MTENTTICSPFSEPERHFSFDRERRRTTDKIEAGRRLSFYWEMPKQKGTRREIQADLLKSELVEHEEINSAREIVREWREMGDPYSAVDTTTTTRKLLAHWRDVTRHPRLFFCQIEALETAIYLNEVERNLNSNEPLTKMLKRQKELYHPSMLRIAFKMATGSGKTLVMGMLIAYHFLNRLYAPKDKRFADSFLVVAPNLTIKDRLEVLKPTAKDNYYEQHNLVPKEMLVDMKRVPIVVTNYHAFMLKDKSEGSSIAKLAAGQKAGALKEDEATMVERVCKDLRNDILVLNDEAHHCYRPSEQENANVAKLAKKAVKDDGDEDPEEVKETARVWFSGLQAVQKVRGVRLVYDLSATPFFLKGSGESEGKIFPWTVSDFSLTEAIESGIVKIPRVPLDDSEENYQYRNLWANIGNDLPVRGKMNAAYRKSVEGAGPLSRCPLLEKALLALYGQYEKTFHKWYNHKDFENRGRVPPVMIVVCQNTEISRLVRDYITGVQEGGIVRESNVPLFVNDDTKQHTILVDSREMEKGEGLSDTFKKQAQEQFARVKKVRTDKVKAGEILRAMMNTVGKKGLAGAQVRCVVSVSMLTEGWDANNVTHILGVRAFSTQLLCEQVVGRALRRTSYALQKYMVDLGDGTQVEVESFTTEHADIFGVPFETFFPVAAVSSKAPPLAETTLVQSLPERAHYKITFPRVEGYGRNFSFSSLDAKFTEASKLDLHDTIGGIGTWVKVLVGSSEELEMTIDNLKNKRESEIAYTLAHNIFRQEFKNIKGKWYGREAEAFYFPALLQIVKRWMRECVTTREEYPLQFLALQNVSLQAMEKIYNALEQEEVGEEQICVQLLAEEQGSTDGLMFETTKHAWKTTKSHLSHVVADTKDWEQRLAMVLESLDRVLCYVKNDRRVGFEIPYEFQGKHMSYVPDFIACIDDGKGLEDPLKLIIEVSGPRDLQRKARKVEVTRKFWCAAVNNLERFGRWDFIELKDFEYFYSDLRAYLKRLDKKRLAEKEAVSDKGADSDGEYQRALTEMGGGIDEGEGND